MSTAQPRHSVGARLYAAHDSHHQGDPMTEPLPDTWHNRELPVLRALAQAFDQRPLKNIEVRTLKETLDLPDDDVDRALIHLDAGGYIDGIWTSRVGAKHLARVARVSPEARRIVGLWPSPDTAYERIVQTLEHIAEASGPDHDRANNTLNALADAGDGFRRALGAAALGEGE